VKIRQAPFAIRVVRRRAGDAGVVYRRTVDTSGRERLTKIAPLGPSAYAAGAALLRAAARGGNGQAVKLNPGPFIPLDPDWGARVACYAKGVAGLRDSESLHRAATNIYHSDAAEAAWWLGLMAGRSGRRARRALRILMEAVK
jgi:hypothetical protein